MFHVRNALTLKFEIFGTPDKYVSVLCLVCRIICRLPLRYFVNVIPFIIKFTSDS